MQGMTSFKTSNLHMFNMILLNGCHKILKCRYFILVSSKSLNTWVQIIVVSKHHGSMKHLFLCPMETKLPVYLFSSGYFAYGVWIF